MPSQTDDPPLLVVVPNVGMAIDGSKAFLDIKATEGLALYARYWPGRVRCLSRAVDPGSIGYGRWYDRDSLPFEVDILPPKAEADAIAPHAREAALVLAGADNHLDLGLVDAMGDVPVVMTIEYTLRTRLDILRLEGGSVVRRLKTALWLLRTERPRRRALAHAAGLQANGRPAFDAYAARSASPLLYFDTRLRTSDFVGIDAARDKASSAAAGRPLRLAFSGRLERMKGAHHLVPIARRLKQRAIPFTLDICGSGSLLPAMQSEIDAAGLGDWVTLRGPIDFDTALVPFLKSSVDLFLCCHPQGDPSCTYLETLGCGVPIVGFANEAFRGVLALGPCGLSGPIGDEKAIVDHVVRLSNDRAELARLTVGAAEVAESRLFESTFSARVEHLKAVAGLS